MATEVAPLFLLKSILTPSKTGGLLLCKTILCLYIKLINVAEWLFIKYARVLFTIQFQPFRLTGHFASHCLNTVLRFTLENTLSVCNCWSEVLEVLWLEEVYNGNIYNGNKIKFVS